MPPLVRFLLINLGGGFAVGLLAGSAVLISGAELFAGQPVAICLLLWSFGVSVGIGAVGTGLAFWSYRSSS